MKRYRKKSRRIRGTKTGRGKGRRARGAGNRGGRGKAGINKRAAHKKTILRVHPELKSNNKGFVSVKQKANFHPKAINVMQIDKMVSKYGNEIDLKKFGYGKLIGTGQVKNRIIVKVKVFTKSAKQKIESAGGKILSE